MSRNERLTQVIWLMEKREAYIACEITKLGFPLWTDECPTADVGLLDNQVRFRFNPEFFDRLTNGQMAFVLTHECLHILNGHLFQMEQFIDPVDTFLYSLSCDAVINDMIAEFYPRMDAPDGLITGKRLVGQNCAKMTAEMVYRMLKKKVKAKPETLVMLSGLSTLDDHRGWAGTQPDENAKALEQIQGIVDRFRSAERWGNAPLGNLRQVLDLRPRFDLKRHLLDIIRGKALYETVWTQPSRKLIVVYPKVLLPTTVVVEKARVLMALDASASVSPQMLSVFVALARQDIEAASVHAVSFDTEVHPLPSTLKASSVRGGGGTSFQAVEDYALNLDRYPDLLIVFTDGWAATPQISHPNRWVWCIPKWGNTTISYVKGLGQLIEVP